MNVEKRGWRASSFASDSRNILARGEAVIIPVLTQHMGGVLLEYGKRLDLAMSENPRPGHPGESLLELVCETLTATGWRWIHMRPARTEKGWRTAYTGADGFFDIVAVRRTRLLLIELKRQGIKGSRDQGLWAEQCELVGGNVEVYSPWWPSDWLDGTILEVLRTR